MGLGDYLPTWLGGTDTQAEITAAGNPTGTYYGNNWTPTTPPNDGNLDHTSLNTNSFSGNNGARDRPTVTQPANSSFSTGLNLLFTDPSGFLNVLTGGDPANLPDSEVKKAATTKVTDNLPSFSPTTKILLGAGVLIVGLIAVGFVLHEVKK